VIIDTPVIAPADWVDAWANARSRGHDQFDFLAGIDRGSVIEVLGHCWGAPGSTFLRTEVSETLASICAVFPSADWHEREISEMFGVVIGAGIPLLVRDERRHPLRKSEPLPKRQQRTWPGSRGAAPGVLPTWESSDGR
jgi:hypothetical protein